MSTEKQGYSKKLFETNEADLVEVISKASAWIVKARESEKKFDSRIARCLVLKRHRRGLIGFYRGEPFFRNRKLSESIQ